MAVLCAVSPADQRQSVGGSGSESPADGPSSEQEAGRSTGCRAGTSPSSTLQSHIPHRDKGNKRK